MRPLPESRRMASRTVLRLAPKRAVSSGWRGSTAPGPNRPETMSRPSVAAISLALDRPGCGRAIIGSELAPPQVGLLGVRALEDGRPDLVLGPADRMSTRLNS